MRICRLRSQVPRWAPLWTVTHEYASTCVFQWVSGYGYCRWNGIINCCHPWPCEHSVNTLFRSTRFQYCKAYLDDFWHFSNIRVFLWCFFWLPAFNPRSLLKRRMAGTWCESTCSVSLYVLRASFTPNFNVSLASNCGPDRLAVRWTKICDMSMTMLCIFVSSTYSNKHGSIFIKASASWPQTQP